MISRTQYISSAKSEKVVRRTNLITFPSSLKKHKQTNKKTNTTKNHYKLLLVDTQRHNYKFALNCHCLGACNAAMLTSYIGETS